MEYYCHYTTLDACLSILNSAGRHNNEDLSITFWASSIFYMNDPQEFNYGFNAIWPLLKEVENGLHIDNDLRISNLRKQFSLKGSGTEFNNDVLKALYDSNKTPFIVSFSLCNDSLPLWNMYSNKGIGVCLEFVNGEHEFTTPEGRLPIGEKEIEKYTIVNTIKEVSFSKVFYGAERIESKKQLKRNIEIFYEWYVKLIDTKNLFDLQSEVFIGIFMELSPMMKNKAYEYEHEVRIIQTEENISNIKLRCNGNGKMIPYVETRIPIKHLRNIVIGPACDFNATRKAIMIRLNQLGINNINIVQSKVPYRIY